MAIKLSVPLVTQSATMECWYASACMVAYFRRPGPRLGLPDKWVPNKGLPVNEFIRLAEAEGLKPILTPQNDLTTQQLETMLRTCGPIWCAGAWDGVGHVVVLTGIDGQTVYINDPSPYKKARQETLAWFNQKRWRFPKCMMFMPA